MGDCTSLDPFLIANTKWVALFNLIDHGSKFAWSFLIANKTAATIIACLDIVFSNSGDIPKEI